ncbi:TetR/AcrR family transcriptional regulator [Rhodococcus wratislaviensis]|uniref:Putative TetR family transcriptional regulator n=1 Tax=Rhodococcus wratislaviensis NBRC 100605 TaxID=1219028 RepID=X0Q7Y9_RHOWR|nr:TetR/AcrR family transcriptional regulator [Rhodococcus wratislaviensis]GAF47557.1 putative TetR family transcriptional regulator [Rhodococcus wratislaviensis NBRC 100605]
MDAIPELRADAARNRSLVLDAGRRHLVEHGLPLPMNAIAKSAGVGVGTAYRHFPTQSDLVRAIAESAFSDLVRQARAAVDAADPVVGLRTLLDMAVRSLADPALAVVLAGQSTSGADQGLPDPARELAELTEKVLGRAQTAGAVRSDLTADDVRRLACGIQHAVEIGDPASVDVYVDVLVAGLRSLP